MRLRRERLLSVQRRREDERTVPRARAGAKRPRVGAGHRRQRARQGGTDHRGAGALSPTAGAHAGGRAVPRARSRRAAPVEVALDRARALHPLAAELVEPLLSLHAVADDHRGIQAAQRHPCDVRADGRLPASARDDSRGRGSTGAGGDRPGRLRARMVRARRRNPFSSGDAAVDGARGLGRGRPSRGRASRRSSRQASPTRTG